MHGFKGEVNLPGDKNTYAVAIFVDRDRQVVKVQFDTPVAGSSDWQGSSVLMARRLKYHEVIFKTMDVPREGLELTWKMNIALTDEMLAGVVMARPNDLRVKGEHGFTLAGLGSGPRAQENYLTRLHSSSYRS